MDLSKYPHGCGKVGDFLWITCSACGNPGAKCEPRRKTGLMRLSDLLLTRRQLSAAELSQIGIGISQSLSAIRCAGGILVAFGRHDVEVLSNGEATLREPPSPHSYPEPLTEPLLIQLGDEVKFLASFLLKLAKLMGISRCEQSDFYAHLELSVTNSGMIGDFAIELAEICPPDPIRFTDPWPQKLRALVRRDKQQYSDLPPGKPKLNQQQLPRIGTGQTPSRRAAQTPNLRALPAALALLALASWGLAIGLLLGV